MSEYDYSPEAIERHLATQQRVERWVDKTLEQSPSNPFESLPSEANENSTTTTTTTTHGQTPYTQSQPQPAFYATPQGVISPTYSNLHGHGHGHSQRHSPSPRPVIIPQGYRPVMTRSFSTDSTPPHPVSNFYPSASAPYTPYPNISPLNPSPYSSPYSSPYNSPYQPSQMSHSSHSQTSFHSVPSAQIYVNPNPVPQQHGGNPYPYFQPSPPQPVVVLKGNRDYVVVAPSGHHVQIINPDSAYETQIRNVNQGQYTISKLKIKTSKSKKSKRSRYSL